MKMMVAMGLEDGVLVSQRCSFSLQGLEWYGILIKLNDGLGSSAKRYRVCLVRLTNRAFWTFCFYEAQKPFLVHLVIKFSKGIYRV